ncbi:phosphotransferase enzyme family protein [Nonomuraea africana]|uniref:Ser/Thr protein kinase RdoA (MazF antagonist) n=1 Tax=Nonomuraea africana TaxID=46171 RepID=A0ABR9KG93_9ACTN|nr:phosphotransferase [Nonomuraea africana]MBE1561031.1 Ser/Thr protein kinase RdoA (MazF antagonist) [Nonomuraea africana]
MELHDLSAGGDILEQVGEVARAALTRHDVSPAAAVTLINVSENATFLVDDPSTGERSILRVHRLGYHAAEAIDSELAWLSALRGEAGVRTPRVIPARDGARVVHVPQGPRSRHVVRFEFLPGVEPPEERLVDGFKQLGAVTARMHRHARRWRRPPGFTRFAWDWDAAFGREARWGRWQDGVGVDAEARAVLDRLEDRLRERIGRYGDGPERFGLIHADMRLANLLDDGGPEPSVIDFDDCGFGWHVYDLAAALSFIEHEPVVPELIDSWLDGYRSEERFTAEDEREIWTFILFRRLLLTAWIGSHQGVEIARELGAGYTRGTCDLAERYLTATP